MVFKVLTASHERRSLLSLALSYAASGGSLIIGSLAQLVTFAILARWLGVDEFSLFVAVTAIASIAVHLCGVGAMECLVRRVAQDRSMYPVMLGHNIILTAASGAALTLLGTIVLPFYFTLAAGPIANVAVMALMMATNIVLVRVIVFTDPVFLAHMNFAAANKVVVGFALARTAAAVVACVVCGVSTVAGWAVWQFAIHVVVGLGCAWALAGLGRPRYAIVREELRQGLLFSIPFILRAARQNVDLLVLSVVGSAEIMASYSVARRMLDSSYLSVEALNRLIYAGSARAAAAGLHHAFDRVRKVLMAATAISIAAAVTVAVLAPVLPHLFGHDYVSLVAFVRVLCWVVVPMAIWAVALEALGASGHHPVRAAVMAGGSIIGTAVTAAAIWLDGATGAFISFYVIEIAMVVVAWTALVAVVRSDRRLAFAATGEGAV